MTKHLLLLLSLVISCTTLHAQVEFNFTGILGIAYKLDPESGIPFVNNVVLGSPAYLAGIAADDRLLKINDQSLSGIGLDAVAEKFKIAMGVTIKILVEHSDKTQQEVMLKKAGYISASYKNYKYQIFFDENKNALSKPGQEWVLWTGDGSSGIGYYVYDPSNVFYGEFENRKPKEGLFYLLENGKPNYYLGEFLNGEYSGKGIKAFNDKTTKKDRIYNGDFLNGLPNGYAEIKETDGTVAYTGFLKEGKYEGYGKGYYYGKLEEGFWQNGVYFHPWPAGVPHYNPVTEWQQYNEVLQNENKEFEKELAILNVKADAYLAQNSTQTYTPQVSSGISSSALDNAAAAVTASEQQDGWALYESFDVSFSQYSVGSCFTSCSEHERDIYIIAEETPSLSVSDLVVSYVQRSSDISDYQHLTAPFQKHSSQNGIAVYGNSVQILEVKSACSYKWTISSGDATNHKARVLVFWH